MSDEIHDLTDKELKAIENAASTIRHFAKYIRNVNVTNASLRRNLDEAIKAGDVTNEQKVHLMCYEDAEKCWEGLRDKIREKCKASGCEGCTEERRKDCPLYEEFVVSDWMRGLSHGAKFDWDFVFEYACIGRKIQMGYPVDKALNNETLGKKTCIIRRF